MRTFNLPESFTKTFTVSRDDSADAPSATCTVTFKIAEDLTLESLLAKIARPEVIKLQAKARTAWQKKGERPLTVLTATIGNDERKVKDPVQLKKEALALLLGKKVEDITEALLEKFAELLEEMNLETE